jgi:hypothetical protein
VNAYVAAKFEEKERVQNFMRELRKCGVTITHNWTPDDDEGLEGDDRDRYLATCAADDLRGVLDADVVFFLYNPKCRGGFVEVGAAISHDIPVVVIGAPKDEAKPCVFFEIRHMEHVRSQGWRVLMFNDAAAVIHDIAWWRGKGGALTGLISGAITRAAEVRDEDARTR